MEKNEYIKYYVARHWKKQTKRQMAEKLQCGWINIERAIAELQKIMPWVIPITDRDLKKKKLLLLIERYPNWCVGDFAIEMDLTEPVVRVMFKELGLKSPFKEEQLIKKLKIENVVRRSEKKPLPAEPLTQSGSPFGIATEIFGLKIKS